MIDAPDRQLRTGEIVRSPSGGYEILEYRTTTQRSICYFARHLNGGERIFLKQWLSSVPADQVLRAERAYADVGTANIPGLVGSKEIFEDNDTRYLVTEVVGPYNPE